jgi:hypothetical protein
MGKFACLVTASLFNNSRTLASMETYGLMANYLFDSFRSGIATEYMFTLSVIYVLHKYCGWREHELITFLAARGFIRPNDPSSFIKMTYDIIEHHYYEDEVKHGSDLFRIRL